MFGARNDRDLYTAIMVNSIIAPFTTPCFPADYVKVHLEWNDALYGVDSNIECIPHLAQWGVDQVTHHKTMLPWIVKKQLAAYLMNMNDDELAMVEPLLKYIEAFGSVKRVQCFDSSVELCVEINGVQRTLLLNVMNMMEYSNGYEHYARRDTLN